MQIYITLIKFFSSEGMQKLFSIGDNILNLILDEINIKCVKYTSKLDATKTVQPWFYLEFSSGQNNYTFIASESDVKASDQVWSIHE